MTNFKKFFDKFGNLKGSKFVGLKGYQNKQGELSNIVLIANINVENAKKRDLEKLKSLTDQDLESIKIDKDLPIETLKIALTELINSAEKNLAKEIADRSVASQAQTDAYLKIENSIRMHKETLNVYVSGFVQNKTILKEGEYKKTNKQVKTKCKEAIQKYCDLSMLKYRQYNVGSFDSVNITGDTITLKK